MKISNSYSALIALLFVSLGFGQDNIFLDRTYWQANPSIADIEKDITDGNNITALTSAMFDPVCYALMEKTDNATIKYLLSKEGNEVDKLTHDGRTYIFWAAYRNNLEMMQYLVEKGAKANIEDSHGYSVMNFAAVTGQTNPALYDFLLANKADIQSKNHNGANALLLVAPFAKNYELIQYFVDKGISLSSQDNYGNGLFHYAVKGGEISLLKDLVSKGIDFNTKNKNGGNAILMASQGTRNFQNPLETYIYLEGLGLKANDTDSEGRNPLHAIAKKSEDLSIFKYFIEKGVDVSQKDADGVSPFMNAANHNSLEVVTFLADYVTDFNAKDENGRSALMMAVNRNNPEVVKFLLEQGADIKTKDKKGNTLAHAVLNTFDQKKPKVFETKLSLLQAKGLDVKEVQENGNTILHLAAKENNLSLLKRLKAFDIDINHKNNDGNTALHLAAMSSTSTDILKHLVDQGADSTIQTDFEESVYDLVSENEKLKGQLSSLGFLK